MKKFIFLIITSLFINNYSLAQWVSNSNGITKSSYCYLSNFDNKLFAANSAGLFSSTNEGVKWQKFPLNADLNFFMKNHTFLYTGGYGGLYISSNDGVNWIKVINSYTNSVVSLGANLFAAVQNNGILKSTNNGFNWVSSYSGFWNSVTSLAVKDNYIFAGLSSGEYSPGQVIYSSNGGSNWSSTNLDSVNVTTLYVKDQFLFAGTYSNGLYRSTDNGISWVNISYNTLTVKFIKYIDNVLYASSGVSYSEYNGLFKSTNNGNNWTQINIPIRNNCAVSIEKINNTLVTALESGGIYLSYNSGTNWVHYLHLNSTISSLFSSNTRLFAGVNEDGIYYSDDNGENWKQTNMPRITPYDFTTIGSNIFVSTDRYNSFNDTGGVLISTDNGINWNLTNLRASITYAISYINSKLYAGVAYSGVYTSTNGGNNWVRISNFPAAVPYCFYKRNSKIFVGSFKEGYRISGMFFTTNDGISWDSIINTNSIHKIVGNSNFLFAATSNPAGYYNGFYRSSNEGVTWDTTSFNKYVQDMTIFGDYIFAIAGGDGIHLSSDNGNTWKIKNEGLTNNSVRELLVYNGYIFSGSYGYGVYRRAIADITSVNQKTESLPSSFSLSQNYPNPFNPSTNIKYQVESMKHIKLVIYDILGKEIATLVNEKQSPGTYEVTWDASAFPSGVYFYQLSIDNVQFAIKKMILLK